MRAALSNVKRQRQLKPDRRAARRSRRSRSRSTARPSQVPKTMPDPLTGKPHADDDDQACALAKVDVPHYCYHPKLPVAGNCRMCLVEFGTPAMGPDRKPVMNPDGTPKIAKSPRPAIACATPISPGMEIYTNTPGREADARRRAGISADQSSARLPDLRSGRRMQAAGIFGGLRPGREPLRRGRRSTSPSASISGRASCSTTSAAFFARAAFVSRKDIAGDDALGIVNRGSYNTLAAYPGQAVRQQLHAEHGGHLSGRRADVEGFSFPDARLVPQGNQERLHELRAPVATS